MTVAFLWINAALYLGLGAWCAIAPRTLAPKVGYLTPSGQGVAEFVAVYGGLEFALGAFFAYCAPYAPGAGIVLAAMLYSALVIFRLAAIVFIDSAIGSGWNFLIFESFMAVISLYLALVAGER